MKNFSKIQRREFIRLTALSSAGLALGIIALPGKGNKVVNLSSSGGNPGNSLNAYIYIDNTGKISIFNHRPDMGQGTFQSIPMIIAEELEVEMDQVTILQSPANRSKYGDQMVVGSRSIQSNFELMRKTGASAKEMLISAASARWNVPPDECYAEKATVIHRSSGRKFSYGELAEDAGKLPVPKSPRLKDPKNFTIIGQSVPRQDVPLKTNGEAKYGIDFFVPGMLYASIERSPVFLGKIVSFNDAKAKAVPGVRQIIKTQRNVFGNDREGIAVLAESYWAAEQGRKLLEIKWDNGGFESWSTQKIRDDYKSAAALPGVNFKASGNFSDVYSKAPVKLAAMYETPYQTHAPMEPMNALVHAQKDRCEFWGSTQNPNGVKSQLAHQCGLSEDNVIINYTFMGGAFGRRSMTDVAEEAADLSMKTGLPVKVIWSREDDLTQGPFRACSLNVCRGAIDENGNLIALEHKVICQDIRNQGGENDKASGAIVGGINTEYAIPNVNLIGVLRKFYIPITYWRSVYHSTNCFAHESFIDELAHAAKQDPLDFRFAMLKQHKRYAQVLQVVAERSGWRNPRKKDSGKGVAIVERSGAFVAMVVETALLQGKIKIVRITTAIDCGISVNPDVVKAQTEGCIVMGLTAAYKSGLTIEGGKVKEKNFDTYKMLKIGECPDMEVIVIKSEDPPEGAGEAGLPTVAPALANAIFNMTGKRIRELPFEI